MSDIQNFKKGGPVKAAPSARAAMQADKKATSSSISKKLPKPGSSPSVVPKKLPQPGSSPSVVKPKPKSKPPVANGYLGYSPPPKKTKSTPVKPPAGKKAPATVETNVYTYPPIEPDYSIPDPPPPPVRVPERDVVELADQSVDAATIQNLLFENIGANELTKFVRHDTVEGINPYYNIISNLSDIKRKFDPSSLVSLQKSDSSLFDIYPIKLQDKIPTDDYLADNNISDYVYFNENGDLVIEVVNMSDSELVEVEIDRNGTIYEIEEI